MSNRSTSRDDNFDLRSFINEEAVTQNGHNNGATYDTIKILQHTLVGLSVECDNFLQIIVKLFKVSIAGSDHSHLDCFFLLFPALCLNWLDASLRGKEMVKRNIRTFDSFYTDDGFAVGASFLLSVLNQNHKMDSLNWFESFRSQIILERKDILCSISYEEKKLSTILENSSSSIFSRLSAQEKQVEDDASVIVQNDLNRLNVIGKRLDLKRQEMEMLNYSLHGARMLLGA